MDVNDQIRERWNELLIKGVLRVSGVDQETGDFEYVFDIEKLQEVDPILYRQHMDEVDSNLMSLFVKGIVDLDFTEDDVVVSLTPRGKLWASATATED